MPCYHIGFIAQVSVPITNSLHHFCWNGYGLKLTVPENSLPHGVDKCILHLSVFSSPPFDFPKGYELLSAFYNIKCEPKVEFKRNVTIEMQHCADSEIAKELSFIRVGDQITTMASSHELSVLEKGTFLPNKSYGSIQVKQYSWYGIFRIFRRLLRRQTERIRRYCVMLFYKMQSSYEVDIELAVCQDLQAQVTVCQVIIILNLHWS